MIPERSADLLSSRRCRGLIDRQPLAHYGIRGDDLNHLQVLAARLKLIASAPEANRIDVPEACAWAFELDYIAASAVRAA